jgi:large conductance mechanosensitive channel
MPPIGLALGGVNFTDLQYIMKDAVIDPVTGKETAAVALRYGNFIQTLVDFIIIAFSVFMILKGIISLKKKPVEEPAAPPAPTKDQELLTEIRDLLKK